MSDSQSVTVAHKEECHQLKTWQLFLFLVTMNIIITFIYSNFVMTKELYYNLFSAQFKISEIDKFMNLLDRILIINLAIIPLFSWIKIVFVTFMLQFPLLVMDKEISFNIIFRGVTISNFLYSIQAVIKIVWITLTPVEKITNDYLALDPIAVTNFINYSSYSKPIFTLLNSINIFEVAWLACIIIYLKTKGNIAAINASIITFLMWVLLLFAQFGINYYFAQRF